MVVSFDGTIDWRCQISDTEQAVVVHLLHDQYGMVVLFIKPHNTPHSSMVKHCWNRNIRMCIGKIWLQYGVGNNSGNDCFTCLCIRLYIREKTNEKNTNI